MREVNGLARLLWAAVSALVMVWPAGVTLAAEDAFEVPPGLRQLFLDDHGIAKIENLNRTMHSPDKKGAVIRPMPAVESSLQTRSAPQWDPKAKVFKLWLVVSGRGNANGTAYVESKDGVHWIKPILR